MDTAHTGDGSELVTVAEFSRPTEAHLARATLEAAGIDAIVINDGIQNLNLYASTLIASADVLARVQVRHCDEAMAVQILRPIFQPTPYEVHRQPPPTRICPRCGGKRMTVGPLHGLTRLWNTFEVIYDPDLRRWCWTCPDCRYAMNDGLPTSSKDV